MNEEFCRHDTPMKKLTALIAVLALAVALCVAWRLSHRHVHADELLDRSDLNDTSVSYTWTGGFSLVDCDVHAHFSGDGQASLQVGGDKPIRITISGERYRELLSCMAENSFAKMRVKRRWGAYQADIGRYEVTLRDGSRKTVVYADEKHFVDNPERLESILEKIYSFNAEFGQPLDWGPIATTCIRDTREITAIVGGSLCLLGSASVVTFIWIRKRKKKKKAAEQVVPADMLSI